MDRETLSNYGWVVILVLILAVLLALATPFGTFVSTAVKSATQGLWDVNSVALNSTGLMHIDGQSFDKNSNSDIKDQGGDSLPTVGTSAEDCTWEQIKAISNAGKGNEYFDIGDTKTFTTTDGKTIVMQIVAFDADTKSNETGKAGITWLSMEVVAEHVMNSTITNEGGWEYSEMRNWLQGEFYNTLPADLKKSIVNVNKTYTEVVAQDTLFCEDNLWIPSHLEVFNTGMFETSGPTYTTTYFTSDATRSKTYNGNPCYWWLRSVPATGNSKFKTVNYGGNTSTSVNAILSYGVVLGFCT